MCTLTLHRTPARLLVTMNRDEQRTRAPEVAPVLHHGSPESCRWIGPLDGKSGGTWMGANDEGVVACLLNIYPAEETSVAPGGSASRGSIIPQLLPRGPIDLCLDWLAREFDPRPFSPFTLVVAAIDCGWTFAWSGGGEMQRSALDEEWSILTSSSWNAREVLPWRRRAFADWRAAGCRFAGDLPGIHLLQPFGLEAWSPLMARERTATRSIAQAAVDRGGASVEMRYWPVDDEHGVAPSPLASLRRPLSPSPARSSLAP